MGRWTVDLIDAERADWPAIARLAGGTQLCCRRELQGFYPDAAVVTVRTGGAPAAVWPVPVVRAAGGCTIARPYRALPYTHLLFAVDHAKARREAAARLADWCVAELDSVVVPLGPDDTVLGPFAVAGMLIEWRHTYVLDVRDAVTQQLSASARNHLNHAARRADVVFATGSAQLAADRAVTDEGGVAKAARTELARSLLASGSAIVARAERSGVALGEYFLAWDERRAYLLHSWFDREGPRGVPSLLMAAVCQWVRANLAVPILDLEGSVLEGVDRYFSSFGARPVPYGFLHWHRSRPALVQDLLETVDRGPRLRPASVPREAQ